MERKRKMPARAARVESVSKKRTSTPPEPLTDTPPSAAAPTPPPVVEEILPKSIVPGKPLPTVDGPQPENLSSKEFQSIHESGVLTESLQRSRQRWISEGIFERYWAKPVKRKGAPEVVNNPAKDTMTKLGTCTLTVEPHIFDATMYAIKDPNPRPAPQQSLQQQQMYRPIIQYGPPNGIMPLPLPPPTPAAAASPAPFRQTSFPPQSTSQASPGQDTPARNAVGPVAPPPSRPSEAAPNVNGRASTTLPPPATPGNPPYPPAAPPAGKSTDPVIQMLAERAASDSDLKALMRIVANGEASSEELKRFQNHIDDLTRLQKSREMAAARAQKQVANPSPHPLPGTAGQLNSHTKAAPNFTAAGRTAPTPPAQQPSPAHYQVQPQALRSKGPLPPSKPDISGVVFEFSGGSGDRYLFPKFSILEYLPHGQVIASFLIVRKGSSSDSPSYDPELDYYQPITIRLYAHQGRQLDALQKVVAPPDEVRRYMDDIMDNMTRAEYVLLAMRLPKDYDQKSAPEKEPLPASAQSMNNQVLWATTTPTPNPPMIKKPMKQMLTDEDRYENFISSISSQ